MELFTSGRGEGKSICSPAVPVRGGGDDRALRVGVIRALKRKSTLAKGAFFATFPVPARQKMARSVI